MPNSKISLVTAIFMIVTALLCDLLNLIPLLNFFVTPVAWLVFFSWFVVLGVPFTKKIARNSLGALVIGFIPVISMLPETTLAVALNILSVWAEEKIKAAAGNEEPGEGEIKEDAPIARRLQERGGVQPPVAAGSLAQESAGKRSGDQVPLEEDERYKALLGASKPAFSDVRPKPQAQKKIEEEKPQENGGDEGLGEEDWLEEDWDHGSEREGEDERQAA